MAELNIDEFYHDCGKVLIRLLSAFPRQITLYVDDVIANSGTDEYGIPTRRHQACFDAMLWLAREGYIHYKERIHCDALEQVVLTEKSFLRLSTPWSTSSSGQRQEHSLVSIDHADSFGVTMRQAIKSRSTASINESVNRFLCFHLEAVDQHPNIQSKS